MYDISQRRLFVKGWSIRKKLILFFLFATVIPFLISTIFTYQYTKETVKNRFISTNYQVIKNGSNDLSDYLNEIANITKRLYGYHPFIKVLDEGVSSDLGANQLEISRTLLYLYNTRPEIEQLHLYIENGHDSYTAYNSKVSSRGKYDDIYTQPYYSYLNKNHKFLVIEPTHEIYSYNNLSTLIDSLPNQVISFHQRIDEIPSDKLLAYLSLDINMTQIQSISQRLYNEESEDFYLINNKGKVLYSSDSKVIGKNENYAWVKALTSQKDHSMEWEDKSFSGVLMYEKLKQPFEDLYMVKRIPYSVLYEDARKTALMNVLIGLPFLCMLVIATLFISVRFTQPINVLIRNMKEVEKGSFEVRFKSLGNDEFGVLGRHFTSMVETINDLIERKFRLELENKSTQLKVLQSQINPHFLYNAFQSIGTLALKHKAVEVYSLLTSLSHIMRYSMNMKEDIVSLKQEVDHVKAFLSLQKQRFGSKFEYELNIEKEAELMRIPKMILQPLVENSFKHGFETRTGSGKLLISAELNGEELILTVSDNGKGIGQQKLNQLKTRLQQSYNQTDEHIGLQNIYERLRIYYGDHASMQISSQENHDFTVVIKLTTIEEKRDSDESINRG